MPRREFLRQLLALAATGAISSSFLAGCAGGDISAEALTPLMPNSSKAKPQKVRIVVSDAHMGSGFPDEGNRLEDFLADKEWAAFINSLAAESETNGTDMELIVNGDWVDYLQVPAVDEFDPQEIYAPELYLIRSEAAAQQQTALIYAGHRSVFDSVKAFLSAGAPRRTFTILFGNHDPEIAFKGVQEQIRGYLGATGEASDLVRFAERTYLEDGVYVEHGNAYLDSFNRFVDPDAPFDPQDPSLIEHPVGSLVVSHLYNDIERERYWIDAVLPLPSVLLYGFAFDKPFAVRALQALREADPQFIEEVYAMLRDEGMSEGVIAVMEKALASDEPDAGLIEYLPELWRAVAKAMVGRDAISPSLADEVENSEVSPSQLANMIRDAANHDLEVAADLLAQQTGAEVLCFGHIHEYLQKRLPDSNAIYLNTGTWINTIDFSDAPVGMWYDLVNNPDKYTDQRTLGYARIEHDDQGNLLSAGLYSA